MSQENKQTPQKHRNTCQECKDHSSRRPRGKKKQKKNTFWNMYIWYMHIGLGCYLQAVPFCLTWLEPNSLCGFEMEFALSAGKVHKSALKSTKAWQRECTACWLCRYAHPPIAHNSWDAFSSAVRLICAPNPAGVGQASLWAQMPTPTDWFKPCLIGGVANPAQRRMCQHQFISIHYKNRHWKNMKDCELI